jgi:hypothetical protein
MVRIRFPPGMSRRTSGPPAGEPRADGQCGELIDRIAATAPVRELLFVEAFGSLRSDSATTRSWSRVRIHITISPRPQYVF